MILKFRYILPLLLLVFVLGCKSDPRMSAELLVFKTMDAHQIDSMYGKTISFRFRDKNYSVKRDSTQYSYTRTTFDGNDTIVDFLDNHYNFNRKINGLTAVVHDTMARKYSASVNSVLYFFQLPLVLNDEAAQKEYLGLTTIKEQDYHTLKVTFAEEKGGDDFEDEFRYWINSQTFEIDYLAYTYKTDGGGIRFREAINKRRIEGILMQDYNNFKSSDESTPIDSLPVYFENKELMLLSTIENFAIVVNSEN